MGHEKMKVAKDQEYKLGTLYFISLCNDKYHLEFRADWDNDLKNHAHFFLMKETGTKGLEVDEAFKIFEVFRHLEPPLPLSKWITDVVLQIAYSYSQKKDWQGIMIEFLVRKKLSNSLMNKMGTWVEEVLDDLDNYELFKLKIRLL